MQVQPYTKGDLDRAEEIVRRLPGPKGFDTWADVIAKELASERERAAQTALAIDSAN